MLASAESSSRSARAAALRGRERVVAVALFEQRPRAHPQRPLHGLVVAGDARAAGPRRPPRPPRSAEETEGGTADVERDGGRGVAGGADDLPRPARDRQHVRVPLEREQSPATAVSSSPAPASPSVAASTAPIAIGSARFVDAAREAADGASSRGGGAQ
jgi:hypothetical protein